MYHISNGEPKKCVAQPGNCKFGGAHFETFDEALEYANQLAYLEHLKEQTKASFRYDEEEVERIYLEEPEITVLLTKLAKKQGYKMEGLENRLKTKDSIREKIEVRKEVKSVRDLSDVIRYTVVSDKESYYQDHRKVLAELLKNGINPVKISNYWNEKGYKGINCKMEKDGIKFELQFHTPESLEAKRLCHKIYEIVRLLDPFSEESIELTREMDEIFASVPLPN